MIFALLMTIIIESSFLYFLKEKDYKVYLIEVILNVVTNLSLNYFLFKHTFDNYLIYIIVVIILEILVFLIEAFIYFIYYKKMKRALLISFILNLSSFIIGLIISFLQNIIYYFIILNY